MKVNITSLILRFRNAFYFLLFHMTKALVSSGRNSA